MLNRILCLCTFLCILVFSGLADCNSEIVLFDNLTLGNVVCAYKEGEYNQDTVGNLEISFTVKGPYSVVDVRIGSWQDTEPSIAEVQESAEMMVSVWQKSTNSLLDRKLPYSTKQSRPVRSNDLNTTQYIIMVGLDSSVNLVGYSVIKVDISGDNGSSDTVANNNTINAVIDNTVDDTIGDTANIVEMLGILQPDHQFPTSVDDDQLAMYPGYYFQKGDIEIYVLDEAFVENNDDFQTNFFAPDTMQLNVMTISKTALGGYSITDIGNSLVDQALNVMINSGITTAVKPGSQVWNNWEANGLKGQWCYLNPMPASLLVGFEYNDNYYYIGYTAGTSITSKTKGLMDAVISSVRPTAGSQIISASNPSPEIRVKDTQTSIVVAASGASGICTTNKVNVRTEPDGSRSIGQINKGDSVTILETSGEWSRIRCKHGEGWIKTKYIQ